ncbi:MAG: C40 family peptidase [Lentisphaerae bacterium]|nr:C40 family peptidase [Lentisphaerota bacterium]
MVQCLRRYEGTLYVWGGENRRGIDCSGLVRKKVIRVTTPADNPWFKMPVIVVRWVSLDVLKFP